MDKDNEIVIAMVFLWVAAAIAGLAILAAALFLVKWIIF